MLRQIYDGDGSHRNLKDKVKFKRGAERAEGHRLAARASKLPGRAYVIVGLDELPGQYNCKVTVTDPSTKLTASLAVKFEILKKDFGVVAVYTSHDQKGELTAPTSGQVGDTLWIQYVITSFERDPKTKQPNVEIQFQIYDDKGKAILVNAKNEPVPRKYIQDATSFPPVKDDAGLFTGQYMVFLNRPGKFVVEIKATDRVSKKSSSTNCRSRPRPRTEGRGEDGRQNPSSLAYNTPIPLPVREST